MRSEVRGIIIYAVGVLFFVIMDVCAKYLTREYPIFEIVLLRTMFGLLPIAFQYKWEGEKGASVILSRSPALQILRGLLMVAAGAAFFSSLIRLSLADATAISLIAPLLMALLGVVLLKEKAGLELYVTILVAFFGAVLIVRPYMVQFSFYAVVGVCSAIFYALAATVTRRLGPRDKAVVTAIWGSGVMLVSSAIVVAFTGWVWPSVVDWGIMVAMGVAGGVANILYIMGLKYSRISQVAALDYTMFAWASIFGFLIFGEGISTANLLGAALIISAGAARIYLRSRSVPQNEAVTDLP